MPPRGSRPRKQRRLQVLHRLTVTGSRGSEYEVQVLERGRVRCECPGFRYRQECRHVRDPDVRDFVAAHAPARRPLAEVRFLASALAASIQPYCGAVEVVGSIRRQDPEVKDVDLIFVPGAWGAAQVVALFRTFGTPLHHGETMGAIVLPNGIEAQLWTVEGPEVLGAALLHYTGPRDYNISIRIRANRRGWHLSQHGLVDRATGRLLAGRTEEEVLQALDLPWLPPPLRAGHRRTGVAGPSAPERGWR